MNGKRQKRQGGRFWKCAWITLCVLLLLGSLIVFALGIALCVAHTALLFSDSVTPAQLRHLVKMALIPVTGYGVWLLIPERKWPSWLTGTAFPIFLLHSFIFVFIDRFTHTFAGLGALEGSLPGFLLKGLLGIIGAIGVTLILRRYLPRCASILFGGRG